MAVTSPHENSEWESENTMKIKEIMEKVETINQLKSELNCGFMAFVSISINDTPCVVAKSWKELETRLTERFVSSIINALVDAEFEYSCYSSTFIATIEPTIDVYSGGEWKNEKWVQHVELVVNL